MEPLKGGRYKVGDNDSPCDSCEQVTEVAVIDVTGGWPTVECEHCAPELSDAEEETDG